MRLIAIQYFNRLTALISIHGYVFVYLYVLCTCLLLFMCEYMHDKQKLVWFNERWRETEGENIYACLSVIIVLLFVLSVHLCVCVCVCVHAWQWQCSVTKVAWCFSTTLCNSVYKCVYACARLKYGACRMIQSVYLCVCVCVCVCILARAELVLIVVWGCVYVCVCVCVCVSGLLN